MADRDGRIPLHQAAAHKDAAAVAAEIDNGADVNAPDNQGFTPLHFAAQCGSAEIASRILAAGALIDPTNVYGNTPLGVGLLSPNGSPEVLTLLRQHGADPFLKNKSGRSVIDVVRILADGDMRAVFADLLEGDQAGT